MVVSQHLGVQHRLVFKVMTLNLFAAVVCWLRPDPMPRGVYYVQISRRCVVHKKHDTHRNTTTSPAVLGRLDLGKAQYLLNCLGRV